MKTRLWMGAALASITMFASASAEAASTATTPTPSPAAAAPTLTVATGGFSISPDGKTVTGTLPYGTSLSDPPSDPDDPSLRQKLLHATNTSGLTVLPKSALKPVSQSGAGPALVAQPQLSLSNQKGCVHMNSSGDPYGDFVMHGFMQQCAYGDLWIHAYANLSTNGGSEHNVEDLPANTCEDTACSVPSTSFYNGSYASASEARMYLYAHGENRSTGGDDTTFTEYGRD